MSFIKRLLWLTRNKPALPPPPPPPDEARLRVVVEPEDVDLPFAPGVEEYLLTFTSGFDEQVKALARAVAKAKQSDWVTRRDVEMAYDMLITTPDSARWVSKTIARPVGLIMSGIFLQYCLTIFSAGIFSISFLYVLVGLVGLFLIFWGEDKGRSVEIRF